MPREDVPKIRVFIAAEDPCVRQALADLLQNKPGVELVGVEEPFQLHYLVVVKHEFDNKVLNVVLLGIDSGRFPGEEETGHFLEYITELRPELPEVKFVALSVFKAAELVLKAVQAGAAGFLYVFEIADKLATAVQEVHQANEGQFVVTPSLAGVSLARQIAVV